MKQVGRGRALFVIQEVAHNALRAVKFHTNKSLLCDGV